MQFNHIYKNKNHLNKIKNKNDKEFVLSEINLFDKKHRRRRKKKR